MGSFNGGTQMRRAIPAEFELAQQQRRAMLGKIHIAKKQLGLADDDYEAVLLRVAGVASAADCTEAQLRAVLDEFTAKGFAARAKAAGPKPAGHPAARKARALWISLHQLGAVANPSEAALEAFAKRQLRCERLQWANQSLSYRLIEALKAMAERHGWSQDLTGVRPQSAVVVLKHRLVRALLGKLVAAGLVPAGWTIARAARELAGIERDDDLFPLTELDRIAKAFARTLAQPIRPVSTDEVMG